MAIERPRADNGQDDDLPSDPRRAITDGLERLGPPTKADLPLLLETLKSNRPAVAERAFRTALAQYPADSHAETGLRSAMDRQGASLKAAR